MRLMGNSAFNAAPNSTEALTKPEDIANNINQDPSMPKTSDGRVVVEVPGQANSDIQQFIISNSTSGANYIPGQSPYSASNPVLNPRSTAYSPSNTSATAACANSDLACKSGVGAQQSSIPEVTDAAKNAIADSAAVTSRAAGVVAAGATAAMASASPATKPMAGAIALGATGVGIVADTVNYFANPDPKKFIKEQFGIGFPASVLSERYPLWAPIINEVAEELKK